jgi:hypothetical protein
LSADERAVQKIQDEKDAETQGVSLESVYLDYLEKGYFYFLCFGDTRESKLITSKLVS